MDEAPNIEPGKGRLVYDKKRRTIVAKEDICSVGQADLVSRLRRALMASAAFVRHNPDRDKQFNEAMDAIDLAGEAFFMLHQYVTRASQMKDKWAEGDENVKSGLWRSLHELEDPARDLLDKITGKTN